MYPAGPSRPAIGPAVRCAPISRGAYHIRLAASLIAASQKVPNGRISFNHCGPEHMRKDPQAQTLNIAVFNCGYTCPSIQEARGQYHDIFASLLKPAAERVCSKVSKSTKVDLNVTGWDTVNQVYPATLDDIDAIIISGSPNGAYQDLDWIHALNKYLSRIYLSHRSIKLYGSCFGHQIICQAIFSEQGAIARKNPAGWGLGVHSIEITNEFAKTFSRFIPSKSLRLQFLHGDYVVLPPSELPDDVQFVGFTSHCQVQGIYQTKRILTFQGHPEFDQFIETECLKLVSKRVGWESEFTFAAIASAQQNDDATVAADIIMAFILGLENAL